uniref:Protein Wnt n=1 Tax=Romanomermis culicivorax TaxID=13658 RepID=A0A915IN99_ROMCU
MLIGKAKFYYWLSKVQFFTGYKETALFVALSSAGVAWSVAKACVLGASTACKCNIEQHASHQNWEWGGCSYSVKYGLTMSRKLLLHARPRDQYSKIYKHNLKAGRLVRRKTKAASILLDMTTAMAAVQSNFSLQFFNQQAVKKTLATACKCHGVSGSCQLKTCWKATADMNQIGSYLMKKYRKTVNYVTSNLNDQNRIEADNFNTIQNLPQSETIIPLSILPFYNDKIVNDADENVAAAVAGKNHRRQSSDLAYYEKSPSFCDLTHGRLCDVRNKTHATSGGDCVHLCCRRGYVETVERYEENCDCVFKWCCSVDCKKCSRIRYKMICK